VGIQELPGDSDVNSECCIQPF